MDLNINETLEKVIDLRNKYQSVMDKFSDDEGFMMTVGNTLEVNGLPNIEKIRKDFEKNTKQDRLLKIGIVGAVKAGKSSLLNALFFDGVDILPKAATPMTAALTELTYGEQITINIEFFNDNDIQDLKKRAENYEYLNKKEIEKIINESKENWKKTNERRDLKFKGTPSKEEEIKWKENAEFRAKSSLRENITLSGAFEQYSLIQKNSTYRKTNNEEIIVNSIKEIAGKLEEYVGSNGKYMPFTSKVAITLPLKDLEGISVVDTPGFNDPVPSRNQKASLALGECDVVLILSPARQFLSANDKEAMSKITKKEGIRELYLIPSQIDNQLYNMEILEESQNDLNRAINIIMGKLNDTTKKNLVDINDSDVFNTLIKEPEKRSFPTSGICESMAITFNNRDEWDSGRKQVWKNLTKSYPDYFSETDIDTSTRFLKNLGNIDKIKGSIDAVKEKKQEIFTDKLAGLEKKYLNAAEDSKKEILYYIEGREKEIENRDIKTLESQINELEKMYETMEPVLEDTFIDTIIEWHTTAKRDIHDTLSAEKAEAGGEILKAEGQDSRSWTTGWWLWKKHHSETYTTANVSQIQSSINEYISIYNDRMPMFVEFEIKKLTKKVVSSLQKVWTDQLDKVSVNLIDDDDINKIRNKARSLMLNFEFDFDLEFKEDEAAFKNKYSANRLTDSEAEDCLAEGKEAVNKLNRQFRKMLTDALDTVYRRCKESSFSKQILDSYLKELEKTKKDLEQPKLALENFKRMKSEVGNI